MSPPEQTELRVKHLALRSDFPFIPESGSHRGGKGTILELDLLLGKNHLLERSLHRRKRAELERWWECKGRSFWKFKQIQFISWIAKFRGSVTVYLSNFWNSGIHIYIYYTSIYTDICIYEKPLLTQDQWTKTSMNANYVFLLYFQYKEANDSQGIIWWARCAQMASFLGSGSIHSAYLFGLLRLHFWTVNPEAQNGNPEQCKAFCHLQTLDLLRQASLY